MTKRKLSYQDVCCQVCGNYAPGDEEYDFCDHKRGRGCAYNSDDNEPSMAEMYPLELDDDPPGHTGFYTDVDGEAVHFLADPNMSDETMDALKEMVRAVKKALDNGWRPKR